MAFSKIGGLGIEPVFVKQVSEKLVATASRVNSPISEAHAPVLPDLEISSQNACSDDRAMGGDDYPLLYIVIFELQQQQGIS